MVVHAFPAAKLGALLLKQISKPIANAVKTQAKNRPLFRKYVCLPPAQLYNWCEKKTKMWLLHMGQPVNIQILNEAAAIDLGANLLGEAIIFVIAAGILMFEYNRSSKKEQAKEAAKRAEMESLQNVLKELFIQTEEQGAHIRELTRKLGELETRGIIKTSKNETQDEPTPSTPKEPPEPMTYSRRTSKKTDKTVEKPDLMESNKHKPLKGIIFKALDDLESQFGASDNHQELSIIDVALDHLHNNVYRIHLKV